MKKPIIVSLLLSLAITGVINHANAQTTSSKPRFGIKAGADLTTLGKLDGGGTSYDYDYKFGFQGGLYADLPITSCLSFMPQVLYSQKGGNLKATAGTTTGEIKTRINYLDVPLMVGFKATPQVTLMAGPQVAFLLSQSSSTYVNSAVASTTTDTDDLRKSLIGGNVGIGYSVTPNVTLNANYMFDFQSAGNDNINQSKVKNSGFGLGLGYSF